MKTPKSVNCTLATCPMGCTVMTLGQTTVHLSDQDFIKLVKSMLHHAWTQGLEVPEGASEKPLPVYH